MSEQEIYAENRKIVYLFVRERTEVDNKKCETRHIKKYCKTKGVKPKDMGFALQQLQEEQAIIYQYRQGWQCMGT